MASWLDGDSPGTRCNRTELQAALGLSSAFVDQLVDEGLPAIDRGGPGVAAVYCLAAVTRWLVRREVRRAGSELHLERERLTRVKRERQELALAHELGQLTRADSVRASRYETAYKVANALTQIPARVAPVIAPQDTLRAEKLLADEIQKALLALADDLEAASPSTT